MTGLLQILGGLALFMFGLGMLSKGMEKLAGEQIQKWMDRVTSGRLRSAAFGAVATAMIQSSGLLMVTMIGLINANLMTVEQSIGVMLGQEIGTTLTAQIVAFNIGNYRLLLVIAGFLFIEFFPHRDLKKYGEILLGLGIVFVGMSYMAQSLDSLLELAWVSDGLILIGEQPLVGSLAGLLLTSVTNSSTAVTSVIVAMGMSHAITLPGAVGVILGANIGSCITGFVASLRLSPTARQASIAQILINVAGVLLFLPFISPFAQFISRTSSELPRQIANAHTIFNVTVSALIFPFVRQVAQLSFKLTPRSSRPEQPRLTVFIDPKQYAVPAVALNEAARELTRLGEKTAGMLETCGVALIDQDIASAQEVLVQEDKLIDPVSKELGDFVNRLMDEDLSLAQQKRCFQLKNLLTDIERVGDMAEDIAQYALERIDNQVSFSVQATQELKRLWAHTYRTYSLALQAFRESDYMLALEVCRLESEFDRLYWYTRQMHIQRLEAGICQPEADVIFTETLRNLERICDHADNLGVSVARSVKNVPQAVRIPVAISQEKQA